VPKVKQPILGGPLPMGRKWPLSREAERSQAPARSPRLGSRAPLTPSHSLCELDQHARTSHGQPGQLGIIKLVTISYRSGRLPRFANKAKNRLLECVSSGIAFLDGRDPLRAANSEPENPNRCPRLSSKALLRPKALPLSLANPQTT
jgi:hypothetical protein